MPETTDRNEAKKAELTMVTMVYGVGGAMAICMAFMNATGY